MIYLQAQEYGSLAPLVQTVGWLVTASAAIGLSWRRRSKWEPSEEDIAQGPARVAGLLTAVAIAIIWTQLSSRSHIPLLTKLSIGAGSLCLVFLIVYGYFVSTMTYVKDESSQDKVRRRNVIGGFTLTRKASDLQVKKSLTVQEIFAGSTYDFDKVWTRGSRALAKAIFVVCYIVLTVSGTVALSCSAILLLLAADQPQ